VYVKNMAQLDKNDLVQMNEDYFKSLEKERLVEVAKNLHQLATDLWEKQQQNSENSSQPPSLDHPYTSKLTTKESNHCSESEFSESATEQNQRDKSSGKEKKKKSKRKPGKQPGGQGFGRSQPLLAEVIIPHHPSTCSACNHDLSELDSQRYMGYYVLELEPELFGLRIVTQLHHYYRTNCSCGHCTVAKPGIGLISVVEGRSKDLQ
jgi:transposase